MSYTIKKTKIGNEKILASIQIKIWKEAFTSILDQEPHCIAWWNKAKMINQANVMNYFSFIVEFNIVIKAMKLNC